MIEILQNKHVGGVVNLHSQCLTGLLQALGPGAIRAFYDGALNSSNAIGYVNLNDGVVNGFVFGSRHPDELKREIAASNFWNTLRGTCIGLIRRPSLARLLLFSFRRHDPEAYDPGVAELTYLAVDAKARTDGIGKRLVEQFSQALVGSEIDAYELSVDADNFPAIRFYQKLGFEEIARYSEYDIKHVRLRMEIN